MDSNDFVGKIHPIFEGIVLLASSNDGKVINQLNEYLTNEMLNSTVFFIRDLIIMLLNESLPEKHILILLVNLSNAVSTRTRNLKFFLDNWVKILEEVAQSNPKNVEPKQVCDLLHSRLIQLLSSEREPIRNFSSLCITNIACFELILGIWPNFFPSIFSTIQDLTLNHLLISGTFQVLNNFLQKKIINEKTPDYNLIVKSIYETIKKYLQTQQIENSLRLQCLQMNLKSFCMLDPFLKQPQEISGYIHFLLINMRNVEDCEIRKSIYKLLSKTVSRHVDLIGPSIKEIFSAVTVDFESSSAFCKVLSINFWAKVAMVELRHHLHGITNVASTTLVPALLNFLFTDKEINLDISVEEGDVDLDYEFSKSIEEFSPVIDNSAFCLRCFVETEPEVVPPLIVPFINANFASNEIPRLNASLIASYSLLKFREFFPVISEMMPKLVFLAKSNENPVIQINALFIISKSLSSHPKLLGNIGNFNQLLELVQSNLISVTSPENHFSLNKKYLILNRSFYLLSKIINCFQGEEMSVALEQNFERIWGLFTSFFQNCPFYRNEINLIKAVFESIASLATHIPIGIEEPIVRILTFARDNINEEVSNVKNNAPVFLSMNCYLMKKIVLYVDREAAVMKNPQMLKIAPFADGIMQTLALLFQKYDEEVFKEALTLIEALMRVLRDKMFGYYPKLSMMMLELLSNYKRKSSGLIIECLRITYILFILYKKDDLREHSKDFFDRIVPIFSSIYEKPLMMNKMMTVGSVICSCSFTKIILPSLINACAAILNATRTNRDVMFDVLMENVSMAQLIFIDFSQSDDEDFAYDLYDAILFAYKILVQTPSDSYMIYAKLGVMIRAFENIYNYNLLSPIILQRFLYILNWLIDTFKYEKFVSKLDRFPVIGKILDHIKSLDEENFNKNLRVIEGKIAKCNALKDAYNY